MAKEYIQQANENIPTPDEFIESSSLSRLQFILFQLENSLILTNRRRNNLITQIFPLKHTTEFAKVATSISRFTCLSLPHFHVLEEALPLLWT